MPSLSRASASVSHVGRVPGAAGSSSLRVRSEHVAIRPMSSHHALLPCQVPRDGRWTVRRGPEVVLGAGRVRPRPGDLGRGAV